MVDIVIWTYECRNLVAALCKDKKENVTDLACSPRARSMKRTPPSDSLGQSPRSPGQTKGWWSSGTRDETQPGKTVSMKLHH